MMRGAGGDTGDGPIRVRFVSCRNDAGARLAGRLLRRLGGARVAVADGGAGAPAPDYAVMLCPPDCDT